MTRRLSMQFVAASAAVLSLVLSASAEEPDLFVDYVTASEAQYVDTEIIGRSGTKAEIEVMWTGNPNRSTLLGSNGGSSSYFRLLDNMAGKFGAAYGSSATTTSTTLTNNKGYVVVSDFSAGSQTITANGTVVYNGTDAAECNSGKSMYIFAENNNGNVNQKTKNVRLYQLKIWQDGVLVRHYLPCLKNSVYGLYDKVSGRIFTSGGSAFDGSGVPVDSYSFRVASIKSSYVNNNFGYDNVGRALFRNRVKNGGVMHMAPGATSATANDTGFPFNVGSLNIGGLDFSNTCWVVYCYSGNIQAMNFGMREPFVNCDEMTKGGRIGPRLQIQGRDNNTFRKTGGGNLTLDDKPLARFRRVCVDDGLLATTSTAASVITECPVALRGGGVSYKPNPVSSGAAAATMATGGFSSESPCGALAVAKGVNDTLVLTIGGVSVANGALLSIDHTGGLGSTEKVISSGRAEGDEPGTLVARDVATGQYAFLEYSAANGFTPKASSGNVQSGAALLLNASAADGFTGGTAVDFGLSRGVVWKANTAAAVDVKTAIYGSGGVMFAGRRDASNPAALAFYDGDWGGWTGGTILAGVCAVMRGATPFPTDAPVEVVGGRRYGSSSLYFESTLAPANDFVVSGSGENGEGAVYAAADASVTFAGTVTVTNVTVFGGESGSSYSFAQPVEGYGTFELKSGAATFSRDNRHAVTLVTGGALALTGTGTFGGELRQSDGSVVFDASTAVVTGNVYSTGGTLSFANGSTTTLAGKGEIASLSVAAGCTVSISGRVKVNALNLADGASIVGAGGTLELYCSTDVVLGTGSIAGGGLLTIVKSGPGTLTLPCGFATGCSLSVPEGEVKLSAGNILLDASSLAYHLDATHPETVMTNEAGAVTNWVSLAGNGVSFVDTGLDWTSLPTSGVQTINGKAAVSFTGQKASRTRLKSNVSLTQNTVFIVAKNRGIEGYEYNELFGKHNEDRGVRSNPNSHNPYWTQNLSKSSFSVSDYRLGGVDMADSATAIAAFAAARLHILMFRCDSSIAGSAFEASLGGFAPYESNKKGFHGEIGEVIAFNRALTDDEIKGVENYLAEKWGVNESGFHEGVERIDERPSAFSVGAVDLGEGGVLDIGGAKVSLGTLAGRGTINNSGVPGSGAITAGTADFAGVVGENASVTAGGDLAVYAVGGSIRLGSGTTTLGGYSYSIPQSGLLYHLDATKPDSVVTNDAGGVTNWVSQGGTVESFLWREDWTNNTWYPVPPTYRQAAINGRPAIDCDGARALTASAITNVKTLIIVAKPTRSQPNMACLWGERNNDTGIRYNGGNAVEYTYNYFGVGSCLRVNGVQWANPFSHAVLFDTTTRKPFVVVFALNAAASGTNMRNALNWNKNGNRWGYHLFGEVIAYDRTLSADEIVEIENYLIRKWLAVDSIPTQGVAPEVAGFTLSVDGEGKISPAIVNGDITLAEGASLSYTAEPAVQSATVVSVTGEVTGDFAEIARVSGMNTYRNGNVWKLRRCGFFLLVR